VTIFRPGEVQRIPEQIYSDMESAVIRLTGLNVEQAQRVVDAVLGPLRLAPGVEPSEDMYPCEHAYWTYEGTWTLCTQRKAHDLHQGLDGTDWRTGDARDVNRKRFAR
jgi:hypothetical protein